MKNTTRFSDRVDNYVRYRPGYPAEMMEYLRSTGLHHAAQVADIGSGTGIATALFLKEAGIVYGVEPNSDMREAAEKYLAGYGNFKSMGGSAEHTGLADHTIDMVVCAQAFHWFDKIAFKKECVRIARNEASCILIWNERNVKSDFEIAYEDLLMRYGTDYSKVDHRNIHLDKLADFYEPAAFSAHIFYNEQVFDYEGVKGRLLSSSYAPNPGHPDHIPMLDYLQEIFDRYNTDGQVGFGYDCKLYDGKIKG